MAPVFALVVPREFAYVYVEGLLKSDDDSDPALTQQRSHGMFCHVAHFLAVGRR
jgi:hypothetical protein